MEAVILIGSFSLAMLRMAAITETDPCLSRCMPIMLSIVRESFTVDFDIEPS